MSPVSRGRKNKRGKRSARRTALPYGAGATQPCDCPSCSGADLDPGLLIDDLAATGLNGSLDPLESEMVGATIMSVGARVGAAFEEALIGGFIPELETRATADALAMLLAIGSVAEGRAGKAAATAAARLADAGVRRPGWAAELGEPVTVGGCWRLADSQGTASMLACSFHRAGRSHAVVVSVDDLDCGAAVDIRLLDGDQMSQVLEALRGAGRDEGLKVTTQALEPAEFRWQVERALDARALHDSDLTDEEIGQTLIDDDSPFYPAMAVLVRARMNSLPAPGKPAAPHGDEDGSLARTALHMLEQLGRGRPDPFNTRTTAPERGRTAVAALPPKRRKSDRSAPIFQIKVGLRGAKPPIWRRLEVPATVSLARLHTIIQIAFGWDDSHLHVFETPYGSFGTADADLGHRAGTSVTLEQVAPAVNSKLLYTYDFGDDWAHDIVVEKVLERSLTTAYPRCTGGRRAAPPDDCGGIWGYYELVQVLNDPADDEHEDRLEWLGLGAAADFDPESFDAERVTRALSLVR